MKVLILLNLLFFISGLASSINSPNYLHGPEPLNIVLSSGFGSRSHIKYLLELGTVLRERGHHITLATLDMNMKFNKGYNYTEYNIGSMSIEKLNKMRAIDVEEMIKNPLSIMTKFIFDMVAMSFELTFDNFVKLYETQKVDLIVCDVFCPPCTESARKYSIPVITSFQGLVFGIGSAPFITEAMSSVPTTTENFNFYERFKSSIIDPAYVMYKFLPRSKKLNDVRTKFGVPTSFMPFGDFSKVFKVTNTYLGFETPRPIESTLKLVGPVMDENVQSLTPELEEFLQKHPRTMYVAFGSRVNLNNNLLKKLLGSIQLAVNQGTLDAVLWGLANTKSENFPKSFQVDSKTYDTASIMDKTHPNIKIVSWAPQVAVLNHQNTKIFLSHGGLESTFESIHSGTPILCMPILGDQPRNGRILKERGIGDFVDTLETDANELHEKIKRLTNENDKELKSNLKLMQYISHFNNDKRESNALFFEHYAQSAKICRDAKTPKPFEIPCELEPYMQADSRMSFISAYKIDIIFAVVGITVSGLILSIYATWKLINFFTSISSQSKKKID